MGLALAYSTSSVMEVFANLVNLHYCEHLLRTGVRQSWAVNDADVQVLGLQKGKMKPAANSSSTYNEAVLVRAELRLKKSHFKVRSEPKQIFASTTSEPPTLSFYNRKLCLVSSSPRGVPLIRKAFASWNNALITPITLERLGGSGLESKISRQVKHQSAQNDCPHRKD
jgi:hypothetical protein